MEELLVRIHLDTKLHIPWKMNNMRYNSFSNYLWIEFFLELLCYEIYVKENVGVTCSLQLQIVYALVVATPDQVSASSTPDPGSVS